MNICIITNGYPIHEGDYWAAFGRYFALALKKLGHRVYVFTPNRGKEKSLSDGIEVYWFPWSAEDRPLMKLNFFNPVDLVKICKLMLSGRREIIHFVREKKIDFCLALWALPSGYFAMHAKKKLEIPYAVWCLGSDINIYAKYPIMKNITKMVLRCADTVYADGIQLSEEVKRISQKDCTFLSTTRILPKVQINMPDVDKNKKNYIFIGRLEKIKGIDILIEAMRLLLYKETDPIMQLYIFGLGSLEEYLKKKIIEYGLGRIILYKGVADEETVARYLQQCDWCIIPSRSDSIPVVFSESLQANTPLIVSEVGDMGYLIRKYSIGHIVKPQDPHSLMNAIYETLKEDDVSYANHKKNILYLSREFDIEDTTKKFIEKVERLIKMK